MRRVLLGWTAGATLALAAAGISRAAPPQPTPDVVDQSYVASDGERVLQQSVVVRAPTHAVWEALTTSEGFASWAVAFAHIDLRLGGVIETSYRRDAKLGDPGNIRNRIIAFAPDRMLAIRNIQAPPKTDFDAPTFQSLQTVMLLDPLPDGATRVTAIEPGYGRGPKFDGVYEAFRTGNGWTLEALKHHLETPGGH